jgi:hypothetical protein
MFMFSMCSIRANAAALASAHSSDPPVYLLICCGRRRKLVALIFLFCAVFSAVPLAGIDSEI